MTDFYNWYTNTPWHRWWSENVWKPSWTKLTTFIYGIPALLVSIGEMASNYANDSTITGYLAKINVPNWIPMGLALLALIHYIASGRK